MLFFVNQYRLFQNRSVRRFCRFVRQVISERTLEPFRYLLPGRLRLPPIQVIITTKCTLRCKKCAHMINRYTKPKDIDDDINRETLRRLQEYADRLDDIIFIGGEAFCNPNLKYYLDLCPRSTHKRMLGIESVPGDEYVDILALEKKEFIRRIRKLWRRDKALTACRYCVYMTDACAAIPRAEQEEGV